MEVWFALKNLILLLKKHREIIMYLIFGVLTTAVNWAVFYPLHNVYDFSAALSKTVAWVIAVLFAFFTNKPFVFQSLDWSPKTALPEFLKFARGRIGSGLFEVLVMRVTVDLLCWNGNIMNIIVSVFVVIMNYIISKFIFKRN
ncbi:MAG: GtrA family protein [Oscillospiraceae bacterium]|nr:GtrA family protein [Oscillospiraceae bacterium]